MGSPARWISVLVFVMSVALGVPAQSSAAVSARINHVEQMSDRLMRVFIDSPSMGSVQVLVLVPRAQRQSRPTVYLLDGRTDLTGDSNWIRGGGALDFFEDKPVNVVFPVNGTGGYYTDWDRPDPVLGNLKWESFLTKELPPMIDARFGGNGRNGIMGLSMGAQAAMMLATREPALYRSAAGFSGCYSSDGVGEVQMRAVVAMSGGAADNMFGAMGSQRWRDHDAFARAEALRGKAVYLSVGSGGPGRYDTLGKANWLNQIVAGGALEYLANQCTRQFVDRLAELRIPATVDFRPTGTHAWPYWRDDLIASWPTVFRGLEG